MKFIAIVVYTNFKLWNLLMYYILLTAAIEQEEFMANKYFNQVQLDIARSQRRFPSGELIVRMFLIAFPTSFCLWKI